MLQIICSATSGDKVYLEGVKLYTPLRVMDYTFPYIWYGKYNLINF